MRAWDLLLVAAAILLTVAAAAVDWRFGCAVAAVALLNVWYWLDDREEG